MVVQAESVQYSGTVLLGTVLQGQLLEERDYGVLLGVVTLLLGVVSRNYEGYEGLVPRLVKLLEKLRNKDVTPDYAYYGIPSPWLQVGAHGQHWHACSDFRFQAAGEDL